MRWIVLVPLLMCGLACGRRKATAAECTKMLDRYIEMTVAADPALQGLTPAAAAAASEMKRAVKKAEPTYRRIQAQCEAEVTKSELDCAMKAQNPNEWEACID